MRSENHHFNIELAKKIGVYASIIYQNISFWIDKNEANNKHFHNGKYWTYNSVKAFGELFPYMTSYQISKALSVLENEGYIEVGNFNQSSYDRTKWYSLADNSKIEDSTTRKPEMEDMKNENGFVEFDQPIPDINTDNKPERDARSEKDEFQDKPFEWLKRNYPSQYEQGFAMEFKTDLDKLKPKDRIRLVENFNDTVIIEGLEWDSRKLLARLRRYSRNWLDNNQIKKKKAQVGNL